MKTIITAPNGLVLRDGKPFGEHGTHAGGFLDWPMPQTLAGMVRTSLGQQRDRYFFTGPTKKSNIAEILQLSLKSALAVAFDPAGAPSLLFPTPADLFFTDIRDKLNISVASYAPLQEGEGAISPFADPIHVSWESNEKPSKYSPHWLFQDAFLSYVTEELSGEFSKRELSPGSPVTEELQHNAISSTGASDDGRLYRTRNLYLEARQNGSTPPKDTQLGVYLEVEHHLENEVFPASAYLGGERRTVCFSSPDTVVVPTCPSIFGNDRYLKLVLASHGDFGGWAPDWLLKTVGGDWACIPDTDFSVRLKMAVIPRWVAVSGWDYAVRRPKAMKKLVPPGSVYLIECNDPSQTQQIAGHLWSRSLAEGQSARDGYGICFVARASKCIKNL